MVAIHNSTAAFTRRSIDEMARLREEAERLQTAVATGQRLQRSSDDPQAASRLRSLARADALGAVDTAKAQRLAGELALADDALAGAANELIRARELALQAGSDSLSAEQRATIATELERVRENLIAIANSVGTDGRPLFAGSAPAAYSVDDDGSVTYVGAQGVEDIDLGASPPLPRGIVGPQAFGFAVDDTGTDVFAHLAALAAALRDPATGGASLARDALAGLDAGLESLTRSQAAIGVRAAWIDTLIAGQQQMSEARARERSDIGDTDIAATIAQLQQTLTVLEAAQAGFVRVTGLTLFDAI